MFGEAVGDGQGVPLAGVSLAGLLVLGAFPPSQARPPACPCQETAARPPSMATGREQRVLPAAGSRTVELAVAAHFSRDLSFHLRRGGCGGESGLVLNPDSPLLQL